MTDTILIEIDSDLYEKASQKTDNVQEFIEEQLHTLVLDEFSEEHDVLVEISEKMEELKELETKLVKLRENRLGRVNSKLVNECMVVISRIHENLDMIGKNQIKSIAKRNNVPYDVLLEYVEKNGYNIVNYTGVSKK